MEFTRVQILDFPQAHPGRCALCGSQTNRDGRKYVDFGLSVPHYGAIVFCSHCFAEINESIGWIHPMEAKALNTKSNEDEEVKKELREENERLRRALSELDIFRPAELRSPSPVGTLSESDGGEGHADKQPVDLAKRPEEDSRRPAKSSNGRRHKDIPDPELAELLEGSI